MSWLQLSSKYAPWRPPTQTPELGLNFPLALGSRLEPSGQVPKCGSWGLGELALQSL